MGFGNLLEIIYLGRFRVVRAKIGPKVQNGPFLAPQARKMSKMTQKMFVPLRLEEPVLGVQSEPKSLYLRFCGCPKPVEKSSQFLPMAIFFPLRGLFGLALDAQACCAAALEISASLAFFLRYLLRG